MAIIQRYMTKNPCYTAGREIEVKGFILHSIGCPQPDPLKIVNNWDRADFGDACVHGFIGENDTYITLPVFEKSGTAHRGWHAGKGANGSANNTHIGIEMCEPSSIKYTKGSTFTCSDPVSARKYVEKVTRNAVILFAKMCEFHKLNPLADGVIISHAEGYQRGVASNHGDPDHLWRQLSMDYDMDRFRQDVYKEMNKNSQGSEKMKNEELEWFKSLFKEMRKELQDNDASAWSLEARKWAVQKGLVQGSTDGSFNGMWEDFLTREQLVTILYRFARLLED